MNAHLTYDKNENGWDGVGRDDEQQDDQDDQAKTYCRTELQDDLAGEECGENDVNLITTYAMLAFFSIPLHLARLLRGKVVGGLFANFGL